MPKFDSYKVLLFLLIFVILLRPLLFFVNTAYTWDELAYIGMAKGLNNGLPYSQITENVSELPFRPPLMVWTLYIVYGIFGSSDVVTNFVMPIMSVIAILLVYELGRKMFDKKFALLSATAFATIPATIFFSYKVLVENYFAMLLVLSLLLFYHSLKDRRYLIPLSVVLAFVGILRYSGFFLASALLIATFLFEKEWLLKTFKSKWFWVSIVTFFIVLVPWFMISQQNYSSPTGSIQTFQNAVLRNRLPGHYFLLWVIPVAFISPFVLLGIKKAYQLKEEKMFFMLALIVLLFAAHEVYSASLRYIVFAMPLFALIASYSVYKNEKMMKFFIIALLLNVFIGYYGVWAFGYPSESSNFLIQLASTNCCGRAVYFDQYLNYKDAALELNAYPQGTVLSTDCLYVVHYSNQKCTWLNDFSKTNSTYGIDYILAKESEAGYHEYLQYFDEQQIYQSKYVTVYTVNE